MLLEARVPTFLEARFLYVTTSKGSYFTRIDCVTDFVAAALLYWFDPVSG